MCYVVNYLKDYSYFCKLKCKKNNDTIRYIHRRAQARVVC